MTLTATQITDMRRDLGIGDDGTVFTDAELDRLYTRADSDYAVAMYYAIRQLMMDASKLNDYRAGSSTESKSQVFKQLQAMQKVWASEAGIGRGSLEAGVIDLDFMEKSGDL